MSTNRGIFETFPNQQANRQESPFAVFREPSADQPAAPASPFTAVARQDSPFAVVDDAAEIKAEEFGRPVKLPERRKVDSPFQVAEPSEGFGFEAPPRAFAANPFEAAPAAPASSPFGTPAQVAPASPFSAEPQRPSTTPAQAIAAFTQWQEPAATPAVQVPQAFAPAPPPAFAEPTPSAFAPPPFVETAPPAFAPPAPVESPPPVQAPAVQAPAPQPAAIQAPAPQAPPAQAPAPAAPPAEETQSDSFNIRQLELRAIFGVDREMNAEEIMQRSRALPGMRNLARVGPQDITTLDALKNLLPSLGFGSGTLKLYSGSVPLEFIREGSVLLAVQTDGGFAPGVRETLMIVARELNRLG